MSLETLPEFQLAAAALATLEPKPGQPYIPVVTIWGEKGSGKTLAQSFGNPIHPVDPWFRTSHPALIGHATCSISTAWAARADGD